MKNGRNGLVVYIEERPSCHDTGSSCHDGGFVTVKNFETATNVPR